MNKQQISERKCQWLEFIIFLTERNHDEDKTIESSNVHEHKPLQGDNVAFHLKKLIHFAFRNGMLVLRK